MERLNYKMAAVKVLDLFSPPERRSWTGERERGLGILIDEVIYLAPRAGKERSKQR